jgi:hypothetical protein
MKLKKLLIIVLVIASSLVALGATFQSSSKTTWEYKFEYSPSEKKVNELGAQGWELAAIQSTGPGLGNNVATYVFKRQK